MMYAVIESGGKQYRVSVGDRVKVESLKAEPGAEVTLDNVLLVADGDKLDVGAPYTGASVAARVVEHGRGPKVRILKFRRRKNSRRHAGHRQNYTELEITGIGGKTGGAAGKKPVEADDKQVKAAAEADEPKQAAPKTKKKAGKKKAGTTKKKVQKTVKSSVQDDDLTQLDGVGPVLAEKLNKAGVTSLSQIAAWTDEDIARVDGELDFKGRIERDDWVGQAKKLIKS